MHKGEFIVLVVAGGLTIEEAFKSPGFLFFFPLGFENS